MRDGLADAPVLQRRRIEIEEQLLLRSGIGIGGRIDDRPLVGLEPLDVAIGNRRRTDIDLPGLQRRGTRGRVEHDLQH